MKNKRSLLMVGVLVLAFIVIGIFVSLNSKNSEPLANNSQVSFSNSSESSVSTTSNGQENTNVTSVPEYYIYTKSVFLESSDSRRVLFFYASWCPTCRPVDKDLKSDINKLPTDITVLRVNYNDPETDQEEKDLAKKYGVTYQHTFVQIDRNENVLTKWSGGSLSEIITNIK